MNTSSTRKPKKRKGKAFYTASFGRTEVPVYRRKTPSKNWAYMVSNWSIVDDQGKPKRRFDCYSDPEKAKAAALALATRMNQRDGMIAAMSRVQSNDYGVAQETLRPLGIGISRAATIVVDAAKLLGGDYSRIVLACERYANQSKTIVSKPVAEIVEQLIELKKTRGASQRYLEDLRYRLNRFASDCQRGMDGVTTSDIQEWLDALPGMSPGSFKNFRTVLFTLFHFGQTRGYCASNPVENVELVKVKDGDDIDVFAPSEIERLLAAAPSNFLPSLAIGAFAGLRSAEIVRLRWDNVDLAGRCITISAAQSKTASRRIVPIHGNLAEWLAPHVKAKGNVWPRPAYEFYKAQEETAAATEVKADEAKGIKAVPAVPWRQNALRHSYASYRFAQTGDAGRVAGELGNTAVMVFRHYRELVKPIEAERWFNVKPEVAANIVPMQELKSA